jgi:hypothetical protein
MLGEGFERAAGQSQARQVILPLLGLACVCFAGYGVGLHAVTLQNPNAAIIEDLEFDEELQHAATKLVQSTSLVPNGTVAPPSPTKEAICGGSTVGFSCAVHEGRKICVNAATYVAKARIVACGTNMPSGDLAVGLCPVKDAVPFNFDKCPFWRPMNKYEPYADFPKGMMPGKFVAWVVRKDAASPKRPDWYMLQGSAKPLGGMQVQSAATQAQSSLSLCHFFSAGTIHSDLPGWNNDDLHPQTG